MYNLSTIAGSGSGSSLCIDGADWSFPAFGLSAHLDKSDLLGLMECELVDLESELDWQGLEW